MPITWTAQFVAKVASPKPLTYDDIDEGDQVSYVLQGKTIISLVKCKMSVYLTSVLLTNKFILLTLSEDGVPIPGTHFLSSIEDLKAFDGKIHAKAGNKVAQVKECVCDILVLMRSGCNCKAFVPKYTSP